MIPLYGTAPSSKGSRFYLLLQTILLTHWVLMLTSGRENCAETFCNIVQGVCSCRCWFYNTWCQSKHGMPLFRSLCTVWCQVQLRTLKKFPGTAASYRCFESLDCDFSWWKHLFRLLKLLCDTAGEGECLGSGWGLKLEARWTKEWLSPLSYELLGTLSTMSMGTLERLVINLYVAFRDEFLGTHCCSAQLWDNASWRCHLMRTVLLNGILSCHLPIALSWFKYIFYANNIEGHISFMLPK